VQTLKRFGPALGICLLFCIATPWLIGPPCPRRLVIVTGSEDGAYYAFAQRYREILSRDGVTLDVRCTAGSVQNSKLLAGDDDVSLAIIQGGVAEPEGGAPCESLASLYLEPVWVFYRGDAQLDQLTDLRGKRIAIGRPDSGTQALASLLLRDNDILAESDRVSGREAGGETGGEADGESGGTELVDWGGERAAQALLAGDVDAAFFVVSPQSSLVQQLLQADDVQLMSFRRAAAYQRKHPFLSSVTLHEGTLDLHDNIPSRDIVLLAPAANLVARDGLHGALVPLILDAVTEVHEQGSLMDPKGAFPTLQYVEHPVNARARRFFKSGTPFFYRMLPFRVAVRIDQLKLVALPLFTLLFPLLKVAPPVYRWRIRSKIYRWYGALQKVDVKLREADAKTDFAPDVAQLRELEDELAQVSVPLSYMEEAYNLRLHLAYLLEKVQAKQDEGQQPSTVRLRRAA
jgi:TRAP-type uncharacterized transport system substrate-binding protein